MTPADLAAAAPSRRTGIGSARRLDPDTPMSDRPHLTVLHLNPAHPDVRRDLTDVCRMHDRVGALLGRTPGGRPLWALTTGPRLAIQHTRPLHLGSPPVGYAHTTTTHPVHARWEPGTRVVWAAVINPVIARHIRGQRGRRTPIPPTEWAHTRLGGMLDALTVEVLDAHTAVGHKAGRTITHRRARITGIGLVADPTRLAEAITTGIGHGRAHGCGLLIVRAAS